MSWHHGIPATLLFIITSPLVLKVLAITDCVMLGQWLPSLSLGCIIHKLGVVRTASPGGGHEDLMKIRELHEE